MDRFDRATGYAENGNVNNSKLLEKAKVVEDLLKSILPLHKVDSILIAGCGKGDEAIAFQKVFKQFVTGIDISLPKSKVVNNDRLNLLNADLNKLPFVDNRFSFIYCYHVLEHVDNPELVLQELRRVLTNEGVIFIGFPNRLRLVPSYFSSNLRIGIFKILKYNIRDYWYKIIGRFKNEYGAHAGFSEKEFLKLASPLFNKVMPIRDKWIDCYYSKYHTIFKIAKRLKIEEIIYPSNYYLLQI